MKKSLIALAVAGAFAAPAAMAEVTLSGAINLGIEYSKTSTGTNAGQDLTRTQLNSNYSHVDLESVDDIGDGNKVIFHYQLIAQPQTTGVDNTNRNSFLGIMGNWGAFKMGTNENVYERFMYSADPLDGAVGPGGNLMLLGTPGASEAFQAGQGSCGPAIAAGGTASSGGCVGFYRRTDNTIWYESPNLSGFAFEVDYTLSAHNNNGNATNGSSTNPTVLSVGGKYQPEGAPWYVDLAFEQHKDMFGALAIANAYGVTLNNLSNSTDTGIQAGVGYTWGDWGFNVRAEQLKYKLDGTPTTVGGLTFTEWKRNAYWLGVKFALPSGYIGGEIGVAQDATVNGSSTTADDTGALMAGIGYFHNLSKQSQLQFIVGYTNNKDRGTYTQAAAPGNDGNGTISPGADSTVVHVGLKHTF